LAEVDVRDLDVRDVDVRDIDGQTSRETGAE
jgi:hypothetical protein